MKRKYLSILSFLALLVCVAGLSNPAQAQTRDKYLISAKAGGINFVSGNVTVNRKDTSGQQTLTDQDNLESGDVVTTGAGGRVEVLLNPGSYLRVGENSEFELTDASLEHLRIKLLRGSAVIEVVGTDDTKLALAVETPQTSAVIAKRGIYRINVLPTGVTQVMVRKGRALVGTTAEVIKGGKMVTVGRAGMWEIAKLNEKSFDSLDLWSRDRAEYLASINRQIQPSILSSSLFDYSAEYNTLPLGFRDRYAGAWAYDSRRGCYVFVPGRGGSSSPYGYGYTNWGGRGCGCVNGRGNETPSTVPLRPNGETPVVNNNPSNNTSPPEGSSSSRAPSYETPSTVTSRTESTPTVSTPPPSAPPPSSSSPSVSTRSEAPMVRENPND